MMVRQPGEFIFALFSLVPLVMMLGVTVYVYRTKSGDEKKWAWNSLLLAMNAAFMALHYWSKAYDLPKHESHRTEDLEWIATAFGCAWIILFFSLRLRGRSRLTSPTQPIT